ncbi:MAG: ornithine carbamoyltransferase [Phycisphaerales bacterium]|nr:ornithine carbamoyltransferase [Phycisphaerales bacterium]
MTHPSPLAGRDLISLADWSGAEIIRVLDAASAAKRDPAAWRRALDGKAVVMLFEKPSLRTRVSFEVGIAKCGGHAMYFDHAASKIGQRESIKDYAMNLERWVECIVARTFWHDTVVELARHARVPVVNALTDLDHPCQALADMLTLRERVGDLRRARLAYIGDGNNVCQALLYACAALGTAITVITPEGYEPQAAGLDAARRIAGQSGARITLSHDPRAVEGHHAVYTDTWISMGQGDQAEARRRALRPYQVNGATMRAAGPGAIFMHCLPATRGEEVTDEVIDAPTSAVYDQAENRMHAQNALLVHLIGVPPA